MKITIGADLLIDNGRISGIRLFSDSPEGAAAIDGLMSGKIPGLEYCEDRVIRPHMTGSGGGQSEAWLGFVKEKLWKHYTRDGRFQE